MGVMRVRWRMAPCYRWCGKRSVTSYSVANATLAFTAAEPHRPAEVYVRTALSEQQVTALNADWCLWSCQSQNILSCTQMAVKLMPG